MKRCIQLDTTHTASWYGHADVKTALINAGANVNAKTNDGDTPLLIACKARTY